MSFEGFFKDILSIPSPSGKEEGVALRVKEEFQTLGYDEIIEAAGNVCGRRGNGPIKILYDAHMDVVDPGSGWEGDPYKPLLKDGRIIARGAADDKGPLASMIYGGAEADVAGVTLYVLASVMEEVSAGSALEDFFRETDIRPDFVVIGEPSRNHVMLGSRGRVLLRADFAGEASHASNPDEGINAAYRAVDAVQKIRELNETIRPMGDSLAVTKIDTPQKNLNIIPKECSVWVDYRPAPGKSLEDILSLFSFISGEDKIQKVSEFYIPWEIEDTHPLVHAAVEAAEAAGCPSEAEYWKFCTNASYTGGHLGIPTIGFGPGEESECHTINESIALKDIEKAVEFFTLLPSFIRKYA